MDDDPLTQYAVEMRYSGAGGDPGMPCEEHFSYAAKLLHAVQRQLPKAFDDLDLVDEA